MKKLFVLAILAAALVACGGTKTPSTTPAGGEMPAEGAATGGASYGGATYGGEAAPTPAPQ
ncbi:MAG TPA: hypothetical protein VM513_24635 [Kofleriaceae bacterium]|jgi:hypothetical protein|nr:hypothetical protein [Kofleriaceae bacterium]